MVCRNDNQSFKSKAGHARRKDVLSRLINRAERRKLKAETFHVYALLQSTVERLKMDVHLLDVKTYGLQRSSFNLCIENDGPALISETLRSENQDLDDPLQLDLFFNKLKRFSCHDSFS